MWKMAPISLLARRHVHFTLLIIVLHKIFYRTGHKPTAQVVSLRGHGQSLTATKVNVVDAVDANMFIVFANRQIGEEVLHW